MRFALTLFLLALASVSTSTVYSQSSDLVGTWKVDMTFSSNSKKSLTFEAASDGTGSLLFEASKSNWAEPPKPAVAKWAQESKKSLLISGTVLFPTANLRHERGTLVFQGKFLNGNSLEGTVSLFPEGVDPMNPKSNPSRSGTFKATRIPGK